MSFANIAQLVFGLYKMIAGIKIAVMFQSYRLAASFRKYADGAWSPKPVGQGRIKMLNINLPHISFHPFIENGDEEPSIGLRVDGSFGDQVTHIGVEWPVAARTLAPTGVGYRQRGRMSALDDGDELDKLRTYVIAEETVESRKDGVDLRRVRCRGY